MEVNLSDLRRLGRRAISIGLVGTLLPIAVGVALVYLLPRDFWGEAVQRHFSSFALFIGMNLANSANPVIARVLMDLGLLKGEIGTLIMTATIVDDLINWTLFAIILNDIAPSNSAAATSLPVSILLVLLFFVAVLGVGRWLGPRIHAFLGAFLVGVALGGEDREWNEAHDVLSHFVLSFFAPIYFVSMGMTTNFITNFDWTLVLLILAIACASKVGAVLLGARLAGMPLNREAWAIGFGLNARGATGIILAGVGLANDVIDERIFVAIVVMALVTSLLSGPLMNFFLSHHRVVNERLQSEMSSG
jgi:Kef-type K+ transport system membrane component KefB